MLLILGKLVNQIGLLNLRNYINSIFKISPVFIPYCGKPSASTKRPMASTQAKKTNSVNYLFPNRLQTLAFPTKYVLSWFISKPICFIPLALISRILGNDPIGRQNFRDRNGKQMIITIDRFTNFCIYGTRSDQIEPSMSFKGQL